MSRAQINNTSVSPDNAPTGANKINANALLCDADTATISGLSTSLATTNVNVATNTTNIASNTASIAAQATTIAGLSTSSTANTTLLAKMITAKDTQMAATNDVTGNTDTANLIAAINLAATSGRTVPGASDPVGTAAIYFGPGTYYINSANALMGPSTLSAKLRGLTLVGAGAGVTSIVFMPSVAGPMMTNQRWQSILTMDIAFSCTTSGCDFLQSQEQAGLTNIQAFTWIRCGWSGFQNDFMLTGGNNNSEWIWEDCAFGATSGNILYVPPTATCTVTASNSTIAVANSPEVVPLGATGTFTATLGNLLINTAYYVVGSTTTGIQLAATAGGSPIVPSVSGTMSFNVASDQFLNFSFHNCKYDPSTSNAPWVTLNRGGSVTFSGFTDVSGWVPTADTYLFNLLTNVHAQGVQSFKLDKLRGEFQTNHALLLQCAWAGGIVNLRNVDLSSSAPTNTTKQVNINLTNVAGPTYLFESCLFQGQHQYTCFGNSLLQSRVNYKSCGILQWPNANAFVTYTLTGNVNNLPVIDFDAACRGNDPTEVFPTTLNWYLSPTSITQTKVVNFLGSNSDAPTLNGNIQRKLPPNCLIKSVLWNKQANADTGAYSFTMQTIEGTPTVLSTFAGGAAGSAANPAETAVNFWTTSDAQRTLQMVDGVGSGGRTTGFHNYVAAVTYVG
jgi:hypothetical protein